MTRPAKVGDRPPAGAGVPGGYEQTRAGLWTPAGRAGGKAAAAPPAGRPVDPVVLCRELEDLAWEVDVWLSS